MTECPLLPDRLSARRPFCPKCGHALAVATPAATPPPADTEPMPITPPPQAVTPPAAPAQPQLAASSPSSLRRPPVVAMAPCWGIDRLALVLLAMIAAGGGGLPICPTWPPRQAQPAGKPAPAPIELAPGLNPTDKTLPAKPATDTTASPATASAAQEALNVHCRKPNLPLHRRRHQPRQAIRRPTSAPTFSSLPSWPRPGCRACAAVQQSAPPRLTCS